MHPCHVSGLSAELEDLEHHRKQAQSQVEVEAEDLGQRELDLVRRTYLAHLHLWTGGDVELQPHAKQGRFVLGHLKEGNKISNKGQKI